MEKESTSSFQEPVSAADGSPAMERDLPPEIWEGIQRENMLQVVEHLPYATGIFDEQKRYVYYNPAGEKMSGIPLSQAIGKTPEELLPPEACQSFVPLIDRVLSNGKVARDTVALRFGENTVYLDLTYAPVFNEAGKVERVIGITRDITTRVRYQEKLQTQINIDSLTGLYSRDWLNNHLADLCRDQTNPFFLVYADLDNFKKVNDSFGHKFGDQVLCQVAGLFEEHLSGSNRSVALCRFSGDEFILIFRDAPRAEEVRQDLEKIVKALWQPFELEGIPVRTGISFGVAPFPEQGLAPGELLMKADSALYESKAGRFPASDRKVTFFTGDLAAKIHRKNQLEHMVRRAAATKENLRLLWQPLVNSQGELRGLEALLRCEDAELGPVPPAEFIPVADRLGLLPELTMFVLDETAHLCRELKERISDELLLEWASLDFNPLQEFLFAVNIAPSLIENRSIDNLIQFSGAEFSLAWGVWEFEVTEQSLLDLGPQRWLEFTRQLEQAGIHLALDDFGSGYSSLGYLHRFHFDRVKIDRSFLLGWQGTEQGRERMQILVNGLIRVIHDLGLAVTVEGLEYEDQISVLTQASDILLQGFFFDRPLTREQIIQRYFSV